MCSSQIMTFDVRFSLRDLQKKRTDGGLVTREDMQTLKNDWLTDNVSDASSVVME